MRKNYLLTPGPTPLPPEVSRSDGRPIIHHRTPQFQAILKEATEGLKYVFQTKERCLYISFFRNRRNGGGSSEFIICRRYSVNCSGR